MINRSLPWFGPQLDAEDKAFVLDVLNSGYINDGEVTRQFEQAIANFLGVKYCVAVTSGTAAITLALLGLGVGVGDEVIVPDLTFIATANAVKLTGASVQLVDVHPHRFTIDVEKVEQAITPRTKAIVPVDVNGRGADYRALEKIAKKYNLFLVCDAAEALGSQWNNRYLGTWGNAGCFSFSANKTISCGQGGMIATNEEALATRLLELKDQGRRKQGTGGDDLHPAVGFNFKLTNLQSALGLAQFKKLPQRLLNAKQREKWYKNHLKDCEFITLPETEEGEILQWQDILVKDKSQLVLAFNKNHIGHRSFWFPLHTQKPYAVEESNTTFPHADFISGCGLWLPSIFDLTEDDVTRVANAIKCYPSQY